ncbi:MAG: hypothetical protein QNJ88_03540 [Acidimicrobiia bacterium]|nr:hypothetical protein [Acidimicrobiia bacterium]
MIDRVLTLIVAVALLAGCGGGADSVAVTGELPAPVTETEDERGTVYRGPITDMSDDRVIGDVEHVMDIEFVVDGERTTGHVTVTSVTITNEGGTWEGTGEGTTTWTTADPAHLHSLDYTLFGTGSYDGLKFTYHVEGVDYPWTITGTIEPAGS